MKNPCCLISDSRDFFRGDKVFFSVLERALFLFSGVKTVMFFLCTVERYSIIKPVFLYKLKSLKRMIGKPDESLGRKATGPVKWQPVA